MAIGDWLKGLLGSGAPANHNASLVLDMEPEEFEDLRHSFVADLAHLLGAQPNEIEIVDVQTGCTELKLRIPADKIELFNRIASQDTGLSEEAEKEVANFFRKYKVMPRMSRPPAVRRSAGVAPHKPRRAVTWLHISDAHFEAAASGTRRSFWSQDKVRKSFIDQIPNILNAERLEPDFVFFTGDVAFSGKGDEYQVAHDFIGRLQKALPKDRHTSFFFVPGNHDVDRSVVKRFSREEEFAKSFLTDNDKIIEFLNSPEHEPDRERVFERFGKFKAFSEECSSFGQPVMNHEYFYTSVIEHSGMQIGIAGLNSAWRSGSDKDQSNLVLGVPQLDAAREDLSDADLKLLLIHHPPETGWFVRDDMIYQRNKVDFFDFVLRGHEHDPHNEVSGFPRQRQYFRVSAGALYTHHSEKNTPKSFNVVQLDLDTGYAWVFFWRLVENRYAWVKDFELFAQGFHYFQMPSSLLTRLRQSGAGRRQRAPKLTGEEKGGKKRS